MADAPVMTTPPRSDGGRPARRIFTAGRAGGFILVAMLLACFGSLPWTLGSQEKGSSGLREPRYAATDSDRGLLPPSWAPKTADEAERLRTLPDKTGGLLGADRLGRSILARCLLGGAISLGVGLAAAALSVVIGTLYGTISGWAGGRVDAVMMRLVDILYGLPYILLVVLLAVAVDGLVQGADAGGRAVGSGRGGLGGLGTWLASHKMFLNLLTLLVAIGGVSWLTMARVIRGQVLSLKTQPFMEACRAIGVPLTRQFTRHLLPNLLGPIIVYATLTVPAAMLSESFLSFLGIGVQEPLPSWGNLAAAGLPELNPVRMRWWLLLWPCLLIAVTLLSLNFVGESLRERFDPKRNRR